MLGCCLDGQIGIVKEIEFRYRVSHIDLLKDNPFIEYQSISRPNKRITIEMLRKAIDDGWYVSRGRDCTALIQIRMLILKYYMNLSNNELQLFAARGKVFLQVVR